MTAPLLELRDVSRTYRVRGRRGRTVAAVDGVSIEVGEGEAVGIAGESGSGKSTLVRLALLLERPDRGSILFEGAPVVDRAGRARFRRHVQAVFQDTTAALDPRQRVRDLIAEPLEVQRLLGKREAEGRILRLLREVGLPERAMRAFPHQLSGGQRQRVAIARALVIEPSLVILDEPVSALDVSIRNQVLNLLLELRERHGLAYLIVAHDLALLRHVTDRLVVMQNGRVVEHGSTEAVVSDPADGYTRSLLEASRRRTSSPAQR